MLRAIIFFVLVIPLFMQAQNFCYQDEFENLKTNIDANCRSLLISNILFIYNGMEYQLIGETVELDSFADFIARNDALYEVNFETRDKQWTNDQVALLEKNICEYMIRRDSNCLNKIQPEINPSPRLKYELPENVRSAFFMVMKGYKH